mgnify:CR=1 FL=1
MKITRLTTAVLEANFDWTFVKVETDEKITGYAEAFVGPALGVAQERHRQAQTEGTGVDAGRERHVEDLGARVRSIVADAIMRADRELD